MIRVLVTGALTFVLTTPFGLAASLGRGYLAAVGAMFAALFSAQVLAALGFGAYFPWSGPGLYAGLAGPDQDPPGFVGYLLVAVVGVTGVPAPSSGGTEPITSADRRLVAVDPRGERRICPRSVGRRAPASSC